MARVSTACAVAAVTSVPVTVALAAKISKQTLRQGGNRREVHELMTTIFQTI